jgi:hypothetical protein
MTPLSIAQDEELLPLLLHLQNPFRPEDMARMEIEDNFRHYGIHSKCYRCQHDCKQYAAPGSVIVYCPKVVEEEEHV